MKETDRILKSFEDLFSGDPWLDVNLMDTLEGISGRQASRRITPGRNTIREIVHHVVQWRLTVLRRIQGEVVSSPDHNYLLAIEDPSEAGWEETIDQLKGSQEKWTDFLRTWDEKKFETVYPGNKMTYYEHVQGILQHDAYHLGQVVLLSKLV